LPNAQEGEAIFQVHLERFRPNQISDYPLPLLSKVTADFSGAEIEQVIIDAMRIGFSEGREFETQDILACIKELVPLARTKGDGLRSLQEWSKSGNIALASTPN
jgi:SpoVK/Ycf46/Vps4 family AAA+-type ATPase